MPTTTTTTTTAPPTTTTTTTTTTLPPAVLAGNPPCPGAPIPSGCGVEGFPQTLQAQIFAPASGMTPACSAIDQKKARMTYQGKIGDFHQWSGLVQSLTGSCGPLTAIFEVNENVPGASCDQYMRIVNSSNQTCYGPMHNGPQNPIDEVTFGPGAWDRTTCGCCQAGENTTAVTVVVKP